MSVLTREQFIAKIKERLGDELSDADVSLMEDMSDTFDDLSKKITDNTDWKEKYEENDKSWRKKYIERFNSGVDDEVDDFYEENREEEKYVAPKNYSDLFKEV